MAFVMALFLSFATSAQQTEIQVLSAVVKDQAISGAQVIFQKNGSASVTATTDTRGKISVPSPFGGVDDASVTLIIKKDGYSTLVTKGPVKGLTYALSPTMSTLDGLRIVLHWNASPADVDSHLAYHSNHIFLTIKPARRPTWMWMIPMVMGLKRLQWRRKQTASDMYMPCTTIQMPVKQGTVIFPP